MTITKRLDRLSLGQVYFRQLKSLLEADDYAARVAKALSDIELGFGQLFREETGTWVPVIGGSGGTSGQTYGTQIGTFARYGRQVTVWWQAILTNKGTITTNVEIQGLPYTPASTQYGNIANWNGLATAIIGIPAFVVAGNKMIRPYKLVAASTLSGVAFFATADLTNTSEFSGVFTYETDD